MVSSAVMAPEDSSPALVVSGLRKRYGDREALRGVDLVVAPGEVHGLLGPNGAGKTTLMRVILGLVAPDAGSVSVFGERAATIPGPPTQGVSGFVDAPRFYPYLSGRKNLRLLASLDGAGGGRRVDERIARALAQVGLTDDADADAKFGAYSAGMRQRLALAAALLRSPRLILLDEPTSTLDPAGARELRALVLRLAGDGVAVLLSSHDLLAVQDLCTRVTILRRGAVAFAGTLDELRGRAPDAVHRLRTSDDARALELAGGRVHAAPAADGLGLDVRASDEERDAYILALGREGVAVRSLESRDRSLETVFLELTALDDAEPTAEPAAERAAIPGPAEAGRAALVTRDPWTVRGVRSVVRAETTKLAGQAKVWATLGACILGPFAFALAMALQSAVPEDTLFGRTAKASGFATPVVVLGFAAAWAFPVLAGVVGGDIFSAEDRHGTWPTILARSRSRAELFAGKVVTALAFAGAVVVALGLSSVVAGILVIGHQPLLALSGVELGPGRALAMVGAAWLTALPPVLAFSAMAVLASVATRSSVGGVGLPVLAGFAMELASFLDGPPALRRGLLTTAFDAWHGLFVGPAVVGPLASAAALSGAYLAACLAVARLAIARRDMGS
ncbi:MAG TPA: ATP-binding cassette domain-containing protein [Polyangiaceae bacterium]|jgi:ABC-2 type transport system ATP-binding protein